MTRKRIKILLGMLPVFLALPALPLTAGGPFMVTGPLAGDQEGQPYRWEGDSIQYYTDRGGLGNQTNTEANQLVADAFQAWEDVDTAYLGFGRSGALDSDITANNYNDFINSISDCNSTGQPDASVVYDLDGSIIAALGYDNNSVLGFATAICANHFTGVLTRGLSLLNGRFIDGQANTPAHQSLSLVDFRSVFVHEFGHMIGLDHSQINLNCLTDGFCSQDEKNGIPMMFPILLDPPQSSLTVDDKASISILYPEAGFATNMGRIQGRVLFSDGQTPAQGYNVIARNVSAPDTTAVSCVSGYLFTAGAGNEFDPNLGLLLISGSRDTELVGYYDIPGLPPGEYTVEVEAINNSVLFPFIYESSIGPIGEIGFQFKMPGRCSIQYLHNPSSPSDNCSDQTVLTVGAGDVLSTDTDIIMLGTPPRYDAWEDGP